MKVETSILKAFWSYNFRSNKAATSGFNNFATATLKTQSIL